MSAGLNTRLYDLDVRHQVGLSRLVSSVSSDLSSHVDSLQVRVEAIVRGSGLVRAKVRSRVQAAVDDIEAASAKMGASLASDLLSRVDELVDYELEFQETAARTVAGERVAHPSVSGLLKTLRHDRVVGRLVTEWGADVGAATFRRVRDRLRTGMSDDDATREDVLDAVVGTRELKYRDGAFSRTRADVEGLIRTVSTRATVLAKTTLFELNPSVYDREQWCSLLDGSTSSPCRANDAKVFKLGEGPRPPAHWACRSTVLGLLVGQVPPRRETYEGWLRRQTRDVQDEVLGATQAKLWRDGGVKLDRFVDRSGESYTLEELRSRESRAFSRLSA